jgi:glycosyltransferase involved in cell wall biosynthesis
MESVHPKISIIIPLYNAEKYLRRCLDSVKNQTLTDWQAICVDDESPDGSAKIAEKYAKNDGRFVVVHKKNGGASDARNFGLSYACGEYIMYLDSDDFIHPQTMEFLYGVVSKNSADMATFCLNNSGRSQMKKMLDNGKDITNFLPDVYSKKYNLSKFDYIVTDDVLDYSSERKKIFKKFVVKKCYPVLKMLRRDIALKHKFIKGIIIEDFPWWAGIMISHPRTVVTNAPCYFYVPNVSSVLSSVKTLFMINSICSGLKYVYELYSDKATAKENDILNREFIWPFAITVMRAIRDLHDEQDIKTVKKQLINLYKIGVFNNPRTLRAYKYKHRIEKFISQIS